MAQLLIHLKNNNYYEIIAVRRSGWEWGAKEVPPTFSVLKFPSINPSELRYLVKPAVHNTDRTQIQRRLYRLNLSLLTPGQKTKLSEGTTIGVNFSRTLFDSIIEIKPNFKERILDGD